jgi:hypothetical protein
MDALVATESKSIIGAHVGGVSQLRQGDGMSPEGLSLGRPKQPTAAAPCEPWVAYVSEVAGVVSTVRDTPAPAMLSVPSWHGEGTLRNLLARASAGDEPASG